MTKETKEKRMTRLNVLELPPVENVCNQVLREVERQPDWSMAHVTMNPFAESLPHFHGKMNEIYVITKGFGTLGFGKMGSFHIVRQCQVTAGSVCELGIENIHILRNEGSSHLEHLVFAFPPFDSNDVCLVNDVEKMHAEALHLPVIQDAFDGAKIISYEFPHLDMSIAFGWVLNDPERRKEPHYHEKIHEFAYVVEGIGSVWVNDSLEPIQTGDWLHIEPETLHGFVNESPEDLVVVCICSPGFHRDDVHYR